MNDTQQLFHPRVEYQVKSRNIEQQLQTLRSEIEVLKVDDDMLFVDQIPPNNHHPDQTYAIHNEVSVTEVLWLYPNHTYPVILSG